MKPKISRSWPEKASRTLTTAIAESKEKNIVAARKEIADLMADILQHHQPRQVTIVIPGAEPLTGIVDIDSIFLDDKTVAKFRRLQNIISDNS